MPLVLRHAAGKRINVTEKGSCSIKPVPVKALFVYAHTPGHKKPSFPFRESGDGLICNYLSTVGHLTVRTGLREYLCSARYPNQDMSFFFQPVQIKYVPFASGFQLVDGILHAPRVRFGTLKIRMLRSRVYNCLGIQILFSRQQCDRVDIRVFRIRAVAFKDIIDAHVADIHAFGSAFVHKVD